MEAWVIKRDDGKYFMYFYNKQAVFSSGIYASLFWKYKSDVEGFIDADENVYFKNCKIVKVNIEEV